MKKNLLLSSALLLAASTMTAAAPEGTIYLNVTPGLEDGSANVITVPFVPGERTEDDIDEGIWRWIIDSFEITESSGVISVTGENGFELGYDANNIYGLTAVINNQSNMTSLAPGSKEQVFYMLTPGEYQVILGLFEDLDGDMGGDSWSISFRSLNAEPDENFYLLGFNGQEEPSATVRFVKEEVEEDGEVSYTYTIPRIYLGDCPAGFTVFDSSSETTYGKGAMTSDMTEDSPMTFLSADGEPVEWTLKDSYYKVTFAPSGAMNMVIFMPCEDQTANNELEYYLLGLNGVTTLGESNKFTREVESGSYEDEDSGETVSYETVTYSLVAELKEECALTVVAKENILEFGYNSDMAAFMANDMNDVMPMAALAANGEAVNCTLTPGKYTFTFTMSDANGNSGFLSAEPYDEEGAVEGVEIDSDTTPVYYNLQGQRVMNPGKGIFIEKRGTKTAKVVF